MAWFAFQVKTIYNSPKQYLNLRQILMGDEFGFKEEEIYFPGGFEKDNPLGSYIFVQVKKDEDFEAMWPRLSEKKYVSSFHGYLKIPNDQFQSMLDSYLSFEEDNCTISDILPYDIVRINSGPYAKLYGIVLSVKDNDFYEVGFKFFIETQFKEIQRSQLTRVKSLFDIWKFPVTDEDILNEKRS